MANNSARAAQQSYCPDSRPVWSLADSDDVRGRKPDIAVVRPASGKSNMFDERLITSRLAEISRYLSASLVGGVVELQRQGHKFKITIFREIHGRLRVDIPGRLEIRVLVRGVPDFSVRRQDLEDILAKTLWLASELRTGDGAFDKCFLYHWGKQIGVRIISRK